MAQRGQKRRAEETEEQRNRGLSNMAQRGLERKTEETEEQRNSRLSDMAQRSQERRAKEIRRTKEWSIDSGNKIQDMKVLKLAKMGRGKWSTKDCWNLARWFKLRRENEE
ncbi:hypothetical protein AVEN_200868-1 [Araneus ventricosus]|uniref:STPR domain-containing protein n=2 Tax=Araneus ventricosus TaxID=182803 RepID=A0A4Y2QGJ3_ARAVE|nr:hypothetical protein AVEN_200868-1 [Araneus ventricosus]